MHSQNPQKHLKEQATEGNHLPNFYKILENLKKELKKLKKDLSSDNK